MWRSCAIICCGWESLIFLLPPCTWVTSMPASNFPEQIRINAIRSRCALFIFAWILNTNAEKSSWNGSISPISAFLGSGEYVIFKKCCKNVSTPKFVNAEPKNTGDNSPFETRSISNSALAPSSSSISSNSFSFAASPISSTSAGSSMWMCLSVPSFVPFNVSENVITSFVLRS